MNALLERGLTFLVALTLITQVIVPLFVPKLDLFWIFKMKKKPEVPANPGPTGTLDETLAHLGDSAKEQSQALKSTLGKVDESITTLQHIKEEVQK